MEGDVRIVEFFGLPGSGKTTLCNELMGFSNIKFGKIEDIIDLYHHESLLWKLSHFPIKSSLKLLLFLLLMPNKNNNTRDYYYSLFILTMTYYYSKHQRQFDFIAVDHGLMQQLSSIFLNMDFHISERSLKRYVSFFESCKVDIPIYCQITKEEAFERIKHRNRRDSGRIDAMMDDAKETLEILQKEELFFRRIFSSLNQSKLQLDMRESRERLRDMVTNCLFLKRDN